MSMEREASSLARLKGLFWCITVSPGALFGTPAPPCPPTHMSLCQGVPRPPLQRPCCNCANAKNILC